MYNLNISPIPRDWTNIYKWLFGFELCSANYYYFICHFIILPKYRKKIRFDKDGVQTKKVVLPAYRPRKPTVSSYNRKFHKTDIS